MNRLPFGIGDFVASFKGDTPGHEFHGNQYSAGSSSSGESNGGEPSGEGPDLSSLSHDELQAHVAGLAQVVEQKKWRYFDAEKKSNRANAVKVTPEGQHLYKIAEAARQEYEAAQNEFQKAFDQTELGKARLSSMGEYVRKHPVPAVQQGRFSASR